MRPPPRAPAQHDQRNQHEHRRNLILLVREIHRRLEEVERQLG